MFQFPPLASPLTVVMTVLQTDGLSHSEIRGSQVICTSPRLIAAYHVLRRLHEPRHPPCALDYFLGRRHAEKTARLSYFQLCPANKREHLYFEFHSTVSCVNMSKISFPVSQGKRGE